MVANNLFNNNNNDYDDTDNDNDDDNNNNNKRTIGKRIQLKMKNVFLCDFQVDITITNVIEYHWVSFKRIFTNIFWKQLDIVTSKV